MDARCSRCNRKLSNPTHVAAKLGPNCAAKLGLEFKKPPRIAKARESKPAPARRTQEVVQSPLPFMTEEEGEVLHG